MTARNPSPNIGTLRLRKGLSSFTTLSLHQEDLRSPLAIDGSSDDIEVRLFKVGSSAALSANKAGSNSNVTVSDAGSPSTPAIITIRWHETDTAALAVGERYELIAYLEDASDSNLKKQLFYGQVVVDPMPS